MHMNGSALCTVLSTVWGVWFSPCVALYQALAAANVECVTVTPTARAEHASAAGTQTAVSGLRMSFAVGTDTANATAASAWMATMVPYVISAQAARHHARDTGEASGLAFGEKGCNGTHCHLPTLSCMWCGDNCPANHLLESTAQGLCRVRSLWDWSPGRQLQCGLCPCQRDSGFGPYPG